LTLAVLPLPRALLRSCAQLLPRSGRALAVADGEGRNGVWLAEQGLDVLSMDFSPLAQAKARALAVEKGVRVNFELTDVHRWNYPEAEFDVVVEIFAQFCRIPLHFTLTLIRRAVDVSFCVQFATIRRRPIRCASVKFWFP
jgi:hypothetical protein